MGESEGSSNDELGDLKGCEQAFDGHRNRNVECSQCEVGVLYTKSSVLGLNDGMGEEG